jgi:hypothetical protein
MFVKTVAELKSLLPIPVALTLAALLSCPWHANAAENVSFEIVTESAGGPPYPTESVVANLFESDGLGGVEQTATIFFSTAVVSDKATPKLLEQVSKGKIAGQEFLQFDLEYDGNGNDLLPDTLLDVTHRIALQGQLGTTPVVSVSDFLPGPDGTLTASCNMGGHKAGGGGTGVGRVGGKMRLEDVGVAIVAADVVHSPNDAFFDIVYRLHVSDPAQILSNTTLARITLTAQSVPEPGTVAFACVGAIAVTCCFGRNLVATRRRLPRERHLNQRDRT